MKKIFKLALIVIIGFSIIYFSLLTNLQILFNHHYEVENLIENKKLSFDVLIRDSITYDYALNQLKK